MAISNLGHNNYIRKPNPFETQVINKLNRYFVSEAFMLDPAAPEAMILEVLNRIVPIIKAAIENTVKQLTQDTCKPEDIQGILDELIIIREQIKTGGDAQ